MLDNYLCGVDRPACVCPCDERSIGDIKSRSIYLWGGLCRRIAIGWWVKQEEQSTACLQYRLIYMNMAFRCVIEGVGG